MDTSPAKVLKEEIEAIRCHGKVTIKSNPKFLQNLLSIRLGREAVESTTSENSQNEDTCTRSTPIRVTNRKAEEEALQRQID